MKRRGRVRQAVMWAAGVVLGASVAVWTTSLFWVSWTVRGQTKQLTVSLEAGFVWVEYPSVWDAGWACGGYSGPPGWWSRQIILERATFPNAPTHWMAYVPIWPLGACAAGTLVTAWSLGRGRRVSNAHCPICNYDLTGIDGVCPECGDER